MKPHEQLANAEDAAYEHRFRSGCDACDADQPCDTFNELQETARDLSRKVRQPQRCY